MGSDGAWELLQLEGKTIEFVVVVVVVVVVAIVCCCFF